MTNIDERTCQENEEDLIYTSREKKIFITVGLPLSGKSTLRRVVMQKNPGIALICADQLRIQLYGSRFYSRGEELLWAIRKHMLEVLMQNSNFIFIDETNTTIERRLPILNLAKRYNYKAYCYFINTKVEKCIERAKSRSDEYIIPVIEKMNYKLERPDIDEGFWIVNEIIDNNYNINWDNFKFLK